MANPPLGFIEPKDRTDAQQAAHQEALSRMKMMSLPPVTLAPGQKIILTDYLKAPEVIVDMGMNRQFDGFRQQTGSCVGVTEGEITAILSAIQRMHSDTPTKAFIPWWPFAYGRTRFNEGDRGQGEGAVSSVMGKTLETEGTFSHIEAPDLVPDWDTSDGLSIPAKTEMLWSDGASSVVTKYLPLASEHKFGARTPCYDAQTAITLIANGYPVANGCSNYIGHASLKGSGDNAIVVGTYTSRGGHETSWVGVWNHPNYGIHFLYWNHWDKSTYPVDPSSQLRCATWQPIDDVINALDRARSIDKGEAFGVSHVDYFPAQVDKIMSFADIGA